MKEKEVGGRRNLGDHKGEKGPSVMRRKGKKGDFTHK